MTEKLPEGFEIVDGTIKFDAERFEVVRVTQEGVGVAGVNDYGDVCMPNTTWFEVRQRADWRPRQFVTAVYSE
jgi:hypothetical protein